MIIIWLAILLIVIIIYLQYKKVKESFQDYQNSFNIIKNTSKENFYDVIFDNIRGDRELSFIDYLFFLNDNNDINCNEIKKIFIDKPFPTPFDIWNFNKENKYYIIQNDMNSFDWILFKTILPKLCSRKKIKYSDWLIIKPEIRKSLKKNEYIFNENISKTNSFDNEWRQSEFKPLYNETDIEYVNIFNQDLKNVNDSLLEINFEDPKIYLQNELIKSYTEKDVKPYGWLNEKDIKNQYDKNVDKFDLKHLPLNSYMNRKWTIRYETDFTR